MKLSPSSSRAAAALAALLSLAGGCAGPRPVVERQELAAPSSPKGPWKLTVYVANRGSGNGEAVVTARMIDASGATAAQATETVDLNGRETVPVTLTLEPHGAGPYRAEAEAQYPPQ